MDVSLFRPAVQQTITAQTKEQILDLIRRGYIGPGERLPSERDLSSRLGVSRNSVREAVQSLATTGVIEIKRGRGAFVQTGNPDALLARAIEGNGIERDKWLELNEVRRVFEVEAAGMAAERATEEELEAMRRRLREIGTSIRRGEDAVDPDLEFHLAIARATHNSLLITIMQSVTNLMRSSFEKIQRQEDRDYVLAGHEEVFRQIEWRNVEGARSAMRKHVERSHALLQTL